MGKDIYKVIGKNCRFNKEAAKFCNKARKRKLFYCKFTNKRCGQNTTCNCFDDKGKLRFEREL
jgi:hypothetical protein